MIETIDPQKKQAVHRNHRSPIYMETIGLLEEEGSTETMPNKKGKVQRIHRSRKNTKVG